MVNSENGGLGGLVSNTASWVTWMVRCWEARLALSTVPGPRWMWADSITEALLTHMPELLLMCCVGACTCPKGLQAQRDMHCTEQLSMVFWAPRKNPPLAKQVAWFNQRCTSNVSRHQPHPQSRKQRFLSMSEGKLRLWGIVYVTGPS